MGLATLETSPSSAAPLLEASRSISLASVNSSLMQIAALLQSFVDSYEIGNHRGEEAKTLKRWADVVDVKLLTFTQLLGSELPEDARGLLTSGINSLQEISSLLRLAAEKTGPMDAHVLEQLRAFKVQMKNAHSHALNVRRF